MTNEYKYNCTYKSNLYKKITINKKCTFGFQLLLN